MAPRREQPRRMKTVTVIVVTWHSAAVLPGLLESLDTGCAGWSWQLIVADNASADDTRGLGRGTLARLHASPRPDVTPDTPPPSTPRWRAAEPVRRGARCSIPTSGCAPGSVARRGRSASGPSSEQRVGITVPLISAEDGHVARSLRESRPCSGHSATRCSASVPGGSRRSARRWSTATLIRDGAVDWATGAVMLMSRACLDACGPWEERFFLYSEETEFALRARRSRLSDRFGGRCRGGAHRRGIAGVAGAVESADGQQGPAVRNATLAPGDGFVLVGGLPPRGLAGGSGASAESPCARRARAPGPAAVPAGTRRGVRTVTCGPRTAARAAPSTLHRHQRWLNGACPRRIGPSPER